MRAEELIRLREHRPVEIPAGPEMRRAAVSVVIRPRPEGDPEVLFIKRAQRAQDPWSGHMAFPGGRVDPDDASFLDTAIRETREEVGIDLARHGQHLARLDDIQAIGRGIRVPLIICPFVFILPDPPEPTLNEEVESVVWVPLPVLERPDCRDIVRIDRSGLLMDLPCIRYQGYQIWGLTFYMSMNLLDVLRFS